MLNRRTRQVVLLHGGRTRQNSVLDYIRGSVDLPTIVFSSSSPFVVQFAPKLSPNFHPQHKMQKVLSAKVVEKLGYYVYLYINPLTNTVFYVGKGKGNRVFAHLYDQAESQKVAVIQELFLQGREPIIEILVHGLRDEETALRIEAAVIDLLGKNALTNQVRGWGSTMVGRMKVNELANLYDAEPVEVHEPAVLIRINRLYRYGMSDVELYEATRGVWKMSERRNKAQYAFAVFQGIVLEVYKIRSWHVGGTTRYDTRPFEDVNVPERWEFVGEVAEDAMRQRYVDKSVAAYTATNPRFPITYVNC